MATVAQSYFYEKLYNWRCEILISLGMLNFLHSAILQCKVQPVPEMYARCMACMCAWRGANGEVGEDRDTKNENKFIKSYLTLAVNFKWTLRHILSCILIRMCKKIQSSQVCECWCAYASVNFRIFMCVLMLFHLSRRWLVELSSLFLSSSLSHFLFCAWSFRFNLLKDELFVHMSFGSSYCTFSTMALTIYNAKDAEDSLQFVCTSSLVCWINTIVECNAPVCHPVLRSIFPLCLCFKT